MYKTKIGLTNVDLAAIDSLIEREGITGFRARDIMGKRLPAVGKGIVRIKREHASEEEEEEVEEKKKKRDRGTEEGGSAEGDEGAKQLLAALTAPEDLQHRRVGKSLIERGQYIPVLRMGKQSKKWGAKVVGSVKFIYPGHEFTVMTTALEPVSNVLHKLHLHGALHVTDLLLSEIASTYPFLRSVSFVPTCPQPKPISSQALSAFVIFLKHLEVLRLPDSCSKVEHVSFSSAILRKLHLTGFIGLQTFSLHAPKLMHLHLEAHPTVPTTLPGLAATLAKCTELRWLRLGNCIQAHAEVRDLRFPHLHSVSLSSSTMTVDVVTTFLSQISWDGLISLELAVVLTDEHLATIVTKGAARLESLGFHAMPGSSVTATACQAVASRCVNLQTLHLHEDTFTSLDMKSPTLTELRVAGAMLEELRIDCPSLTCVRLKDCPKLRPASFQLGLCLLSSAELDDSINNSVRAMIKALEKVPEKTQLPRQEAPPRKSAKTSKAKTGQKKRGTASSK